MRIAAAASFLLLATLSTSSLSGCAGPDEPAASDQASLVPARSPVGCVALAPIEGEGAADTLVCVEHSGAAGRVSVAGADAPLLERTPALRARRSVVASAIAPAGTFRFGDWSRTWDEVTYRSDQVDLAFFVASDPEAHPDTPVIAFAFGRVFEAYPRFAGFLPLAREPRCSTTSGDPPVVTCAGVIEDAFTHGRGCADLVDGPAHGAAPSAGHVCVDATASGGPLELALGGVILVDRQLATRTTSIVPGSMDCALSILPPDACEALHGERRIVAYRAGDVGLRLSAPTAPQRHLEVVAEIGGRRLTLRPTFAP